MYPYNIQNPYYQPQPQPTQNYYGPQPSKTQLIKVNGLDGAKAYQMSPNSTAALFDINSDTLFIKSTDGAGFPQIRTFQFTQMTQKQQQSYITRKQYEELKKQISALKEMINHEQQPVFGSID